MVKSDDQITTAVEDAVLTSHELSYPTEDDGVVAFVEPSTGVFAAEWASSSLSPCLYIYRWYCYGWYSGGGADGGGVDGGDSASERVTAPAPLPSLDHELWLLILTFIRRDQLGP